MSVSCGILNPFSARFLRVSLSLLAKVDPLLAKFHCAIHQPGGHVRDYKNGNRTYHTEIVHKYRTTIFTYSV